MKKISYALLIALGLNSTMVYAADSSNAKLNTVKQMYQYHIKTGGEKNTLGQFADSGLKQALKQMNQYNKKHPGELSCIEEDPMTNSQDPQAALRGRQPKLSLLPSGQVKASMASGKVTYSLSCAGNQCKVSDVFSSGGSLKQQIHQYCR